LDSCQCGALGRARKGGSILAFGIQHFVFGRYAAGLGPPWIPGRPLLAYLFGVIFVAAGAAIIIRKKHDLAATLLASIAFLYFLLLYVPKIINQLHNPGPWTSGFEILAMCGSALVLASSLPKEQNERV
jgi:uncharacterized membrane protein